MNWNHCEDVGEEEHIYTSKMQQAKKYSITMAHMSIFYNNMLHTVSTLYEKGIYENDYDYFNVIIHHFM